MTTARIERIELGTLEGTRPRSAGSNARLGDHGATIRMPIVRVTDADGATGFGLSRATPEHLATLIGTRFDDTLNPSRGVSDALVPIEFPILDLIGKRQQKAVYRLVSDSATPLQVPCYDTSLYFDDLHLAADDEAVALIADEAHQGLARGHRNFKIKVGRGARHMDLDAGTKREIAIIQAVRDVAGPNARVMIDANNGYNLNLTKHVLQETADCALYWLEEPFHEDAVLYRDLREWLASENLPILIADGEGDASPHLMQWAKEGIVDVIQYDAISPGFSRWLRFGRTLDADGAKSAPHHYGTLYGNYTTCHLAPAISGFQMAEWDEASAPGLDGSDYVIADGVVTVPDEPGFGLRLDDELFSRAVKTNGTTLGQ